MEKIIVSKDGRPDGCITYVSEKVGGAFSALPCVSGVFYRDKRTALEFSTEKIYEPYVRKEAVSAVADAIVIYYKHRFFFEKLALPALSAEERELFLAALTAADFRVDKRYAESRLFELAEYPMDGVFAFRLRELKDSWERIASCVTTNFSKVSLHAFLRFLSSEGEGRIFLRGDAAYDEEYRPLKKSELIGKYSAPKEILLSGAKIVYCFGEISTATREFLKNYYPEKTFFC